jgi:GH25 family lysozyme M1 (1,4-beta-N-acetylmuramidase)
MTIFGPDISNNNGPNLDMWQIRNEGFDFIFCKVSEGDYFVDRTWPRYRDAARAAGLLVAGYHYVRADCDAVAQANLFVDNLGEGIPAMLDFEANSGGIDVFWNVVRAINARGVEVALSYVPRWYWQQIGSPDISAVPNLIQSSYVNGSGYASDLYPGDDSYNWNGFGGADVKILQFSDAGLVAGSSVDVNAFRGTRDELAALLTLQPIPAAPIQEGPLMALNDDEQRELLEKVRYIAGQLGPWPQLGANDKGEPLTVVDALAKHTGGGTK